MISDCPADTAGTGLQLLFRMMILLTLIYVLRRQPDPLALNV